MSRSRPAVLARSPTERVFERRTLKNTRSQINFMYSEPVCATVANTAYVRARLLQRYEIICSLDDYSPSRWFLPTKSDATEFSLVSSFFFSEQRRHFSQSCDKACGWVPYRRQHHMIRINHYLSNASRRIGILSRKLYTVHARISVVRIEAKIRICSWRSDVPVDR